MFRKINSLFLTILAFLVFSTIYIIYSNSFDALAYSASIYTSGMVNLEVSASGHSANIATDEIEIISTCPSGYTVSIKGPADSTLYKVNQSTGKADKTNANANNKIIPTTGTKDSPLPIIGDDGSGNSYLGTWGYSMTSNVATGNFIGLTNTMTELLTSNTGTTEDGETLSVYYGASILPTTEPGQYKLAESTNGAEDDVITYFLTTPIECDPYIIKYNGNNNDPGTTMSVTNTVSKDETTTLMPSNFKRSGYGFAGWNTKADGTGENFGPMEDVTLSESDTKGNALLNLANSDKEIILYAKWIQSQGNLQNWNGCSAMNIGDVTALTDTRDDDTYAIAKLADGNCWMVENLRLDNTATITSTNTNNPANGFVLSASVDPKQTRWCSASNAACIDQSMFYSGNTADAVVDMDEDATRNIYSYGNYYNWYSATAGNGTYSFDTNGTSVTGDICPSGWRLPTGGNNGELNDMNTAINSGSRDTDAGLKTYPNNFLYSGIVSDVAVRSRGDSGYFWSRTTNSATYAVNLFFMSRSVTPGTYSNGKIGGYAVRCITDPTPKASSGKIMYHENEANSPTDMGEQDPGNNATEATLWASNFQRSGYGFAGWNTKADGTGTSYGPNETITLPADFKTNGLNLYAIWVPSAGNLQSWTGCSAMNIGDVTALTDTRDNDTYAVAKLADGKCWMIENLRLDNTATITSANTNNPVNGFALSASSSSWCTDANAACYDQSIVNTDNTVNSVANMTTPTDANVYGYGNYYNWYSATAGNGTYSKSSGNTAGDICPKGWHLPIGNNGGEFSALDTAMGGTGAQGTAEASKRWRVYPNNFLYSGYVNSSSAFDRSRYGGFWSSTAYNVTTAYILDFYSSSYVEPGTYYGDKNFGFAVRCLAQ